MWRAVTHPQTCYSNRLSCLFMMSAALCPGSKTTTCNYSSDITASKILNRWIISDKWTHHVELNGKPPSKNINEKRWLTLSSWVLDPGICCHIVWWCTVFLSFPDNRPNIDIRQWLFSATAVFDCRKLFSYLKCQRRTSWCPSPRIREQRDSFSTQYFCTNIQPGEK